MAAFIFLSERFLKKKVKRNMKKALAILLTAVMLLGVLTACLCAAVYGALTLMCAFISRGHPRGMLAAYVLLFVPVVNLFLALLGEADLLFQLRGRMMRGVKNGTSGKL